MKVLQIKAWDVDGNIVTVEDYKELLEKVMSMKQLASEMGIYELASFDDIINNIELIVIGDLEPGEDPS